MHRRTWVILIVVGVVAAVAAGWILFRQTLRSAPRTARVVEFIRRAEEHPDWLVEAGSRCGDAPFQFPTTGFVGFVWDDSFRPLHRHSGIDVFGGSEPGVTPVYAAYDAYLSRETGWISSLILRVPVDPLQPDRQIWLYYTHMADPQGNSLIDTPFPAGTREVFVPAGTRLGWQGNFSGTPGNPVGVHLHLSIVKDDGVGQYLDERRIENTLDPSPYFGFPLHADFMRKALPLCEIN